MTDHGAVLNTDREIFREREGHFYSNSVSVTKEGALCINVGGTVICKSLAVWHMLAADKLPSPTPPTACEYCGPVCYKGGAHNARVEDGAKWEPTPPTETQEVYDKSAEDELMACIVAAPTERVETSERRQALLDARDAVVAVANRYKPALGQFDYIKWNTADNCRIAINELLAAVAPSPAGESQEATNV